MKKTSIVIAVLAILLSFSCQKEVTEENSSLVSKTEQENWQTVKLDAKFAESQKQVAAYLFPKDEMAKLAETPNVKTVRFVLGYNDSTLQIKIIGVDKSGNELESVDSVILKEFFSEDKFSFLKASNSKVIKGVEVLDKHLVLPQEAVEGIEAWQEKLDKVSDLDEITSYEGKRFKHYSLEVEVITDMLKNKKTANIGVFLGLNPVGKVTTFLIGLDKNNTIKGSLTGKEKSAEDVYDGTRPSPPF